MGKQECNHYWDEIGKGSAFANPDGAFIDSSIAISTQITVRREVQGSLAQWPSVDIPVKNEAFAVPKGYNAPQQVHITQGDYEGKAGIISMTNYTFYKYKSGYIHHCLLEGLECNTRYYYRFGNGDSSRELWFDTPPKVEPDAPYKSGIIAVTKLIISMRTVFESWFIHYKVDIVFAGHVHAYESSYRFSNIHHNITSGYRYPVAMDTPHWRYKMEHVLSITGIVMKMARKCQLTHSYCITNIVLDEGHMTLVNRHQFEKKKTEEALP
ncbi:hypothetical protein L6164_014291 [Bauhinia variegata]|uniref:Uncharacterized protein n=1 Tax=Bauhinia variegata TaxID=167791 RepID=A0ACB9NH11_BAUVA|nr:hypothetical protein L6164_014291 [Bauhinia variegata]